jgi:hypothetical protein
VIAQARLCGATGHLSQGQIDLVAAVPHGHHDAGQQGQHENAHDTLVVDAVADMNRAAGDAGRRIEGRVDGVVHRSVLFPLPALVKIGFQIFE